MHEQLSGGFRCFVSCRQRREEKMVGKQEKAPLLIFVIIDHALLSRSLFNPAETSQLNMQRCLHGSFSAASNTHFSSDLRAIRCFNSSGRDSLRILGVPAPANHVNGCLQKSNVQNGNLKRSMGWGNTLNATPRTVL